MLTRQDAPPLLDRRPKCGRQPASWMDYSKLLAKCKYYTWAYHSFSSFPGSCLLPERPKAKHFLKSSFKHLLLVTLQTNSLLKSVFCLNSKGSWNSCTLKIVLLLLCNHKLMIEFCLKGRILRNEFKKSKINRWHI